MAINSTKYYFNQIANVIAPQKYKELLKSKMFTTQDFSTKGNGVKTIIRNLQLQYKNDFKGIYVIYEDDKPIYVGISKKVLTRLRQHVRCVKQNRHSLQRGSLFCMPNIKEEVINGKTDTESRCNNWV